jgi:predicted RNase H-like nuclease (RuvC/YqgF family)
MKEFIQVLINYLEKKIKDETLVDYPIQQYPTQIKGETITDLKKQIKKLKQKMCFQEKDINSLRKEEITSLRSEINSLKGVITSQKTEIENLNKLKEFFFKNPKQSVRRGTPAAKP